MKGGGGGGNVIVVVVDDDVGCTVEPFIASNCTDLLELGGTCV